MLPALLPARLALLLAAPLLAAPLPTPIPFTHAWDTALQSQFIDTGYTTFTPAQAQFVASHYAIVSLEKCFQPRGAKGATEVSIWRQAAALKQLNPALKVLFYLHTDIVRLDCYAAHATYMAHPEWWLTDAAGRFINDTDGQPRLDTSLPAARAWWASVPLNGTTGAALLEGSNRTLASLIDGVLADGTGQRCPTPKVNASRCSELVEGKAAMVRELQGILTAANGGAVFGNGIEMYPNLAPGYNLDFLPARADMGGVMLEHFAAFEHVRPNGTLNADLVASSMQAVAQAAASGKAVVVATWPGLLKTPFNSDGLPSWPGGTQPNTTEGWRAALAQKHTFALAGFLVVAEANVWQQYQGWYQSTAGAIACPEDPASCIAPDPWYPALSMPLGPPLGPAVREGNVWRRAFAQAAVVFDVENPDASSVTFFSASPSPSLSASLSATPTPSPSASPSASATPTPSTSPSPTPTPVAAPGASASAAASALLSAPPSPSPAQSPPQSPPPLQQQQQQLSASGPAALSPGDSAGLAVGLLLGAAACGGAALLRWRSGRRSLAALPQQGAEAASAHEAQEVKQQQVEARRNPIWGAL